MKRRTLMAFTGLLAQAILAAGNWPEGYEVRENSQSPDGRYAIIVPKDLNVNGDKPNVNYLVDLQTQNLLGPIKYSDYFNGQNHADLQVFWSPDSKWCVAEYENRFGFDRIWLIEPKESTFDLVDIGERLERKLNTLLGEPPRERKEEPVLGVGTAYIRLHNDRAIEIYAVATGDYKEMNEKAAHAFAAGAYDAHRKEWKTIRGRRITFDDYVTIESAFDTLPSPESTDWAAALENTLNRVYHAARVILPPDRFAQIRREQIAWLKTREGASSLEEKCQLTLARIKQLQENLW